MWREVPINDVGPILEQYLQSNVALIEEDLGQCLPFEGLPGHLLDLLQRDLRTWSLAEYDDVIANVGTVRGFCCRR